MPLPSVLINDANVGDVVGYGRGRGRGGGGVGGGGGGAMAAAVVRGRTLPRTEGRAKNFGVNQDTGKSTIRTHESVSRQRTAVTCGRKATLCQEAMKRKEIKHGEGSEGARFSKRGRENDGNAIDASKGSSQSSTAQQQQQQQQQQRRLKPTTLRMAKNVGESRIPLVSRASFLPKPKVLGQPKVSEIRRSVIISSSVKNATVNNVTPPKEMGSVPVTSTPAIKDNLAYVTFSVSPVENVSVNDLGKTICFGKGTGILRYWGRLEGEEGIWCGVELSRPEGLNDGTYRGFRYFACPPNHGIMWPVSKVHWIEGSGSDCNYCTQLSTELTLNDEEAQEQKSPNSGSTDAIANNTFLWDNNVRPEATFEIEKGVTLDGSKDTSGTTFVIANEEIGAKTGEAVTNVTTIITNESRDSENKLALKNRTKQKGSVPKTPSPVSQTKTFKDTRLVSPGKSGICGINTKVVSPIKTNDGKLLNSEAGANSTYTKVKNGASTTMNGSVESPKYGSSAKVNDTYVAAKPKTKEESSTYATSHLNSDKIVDAVYNAKNNERRNNKVADVTDLVGKGLIADFIANISPTPKPSGAMFTLNDTFIYEQPTRRKAILPALVPIDTCMSVSPTKEAPFSQKQDCFVREKLGLLEDKVSVDNKAFDLVNTTFDEKSGAKALPYELPREHASIITEEEMNVSFLSGRESIDWTFLKGSKRNEGLFEGFSSIGERTTSVGGTNGSDVDDKCRVSSTVETSDVHRGARNANTVFNITVRESFGMPGVFQNSHVSLIEDVSSSCLIDSTIPEPHSLPGFRGIEDEEESVPPVTLAPSKVNPAPYYLMLNKQNSFEPDESLGILTPDQMADFTVELECSRSASCENLTGSAGSRMALTRASASRPSDLPTSVDGEPTEGSSERTPSPEELPLDPKPVESAEPMRTVPMSFVTSVTSITSLEAGYQGDGENSRPASRSADLPPMAPLPNLPAACRHDPMTDSDFFTESDADAHEEIVRGDRRAQVIDGTLFCAPGGRRCPSFMGEEMESSGIYSDLDKKQDERHPEEAQSEDRTPDTVDTVSQKSQPSPNRLELQAPVIMDCLQVPSCQNPLDGSMESDISPTRLELTAIEMNVENSPPKVLNKSDPMPLKKYKMPKRNVVSKIKAMIESGPKAEAEKEARRSPRTLKKGGRWDAVMSKIEAGKSEQRSRLPRKEVKSRVLENLGPSPPSVSRRPTAGDSGNKSKRRTRGRQDVSSPTRETAHSSVHSSMSDLSSSLRSAKKRLGSPGGSEGSVQSTPRISSPRHQQPPSSLTTTNSGVGSTGTTNNNNNINSSHQHNNNNNNNNTNSGSNNNHNHHRAPSLSQRSPNTTSPPRRSTNARNNQQARIGNSEVKKSSLDVSKINLERSPSTTRKPAVSRRLPMKLQTSAPTKDRGAKETTNTATRNSVETRDQADQTEPTYETLQVRQAEVSVQALSVIVQYLAHQLDGFSAPKLKKDCERMKTEWLAARVEAEELKARNLRMEKRLNDEREDHRKTLELRADLETRHAERVAELEWALQEASDKFEARLYESLSESAREHQTAIARLRAEHEADVVRREAETDRRSVVHDQGAALRAEVQSLRSVLELRSQEITALRSEIDAFKREIEAKEALEQRTEILETRCEDLMAQLQRKESFERQLSHENNVLLQSFHEESMHKKRLSQKNEELQWRLRQNNEVVTVLANQLATPPQRLSRSLGPEHTDHTHSPDDSPPASPMVKSMVEKSDSVSWTLEIEETPEAMVSRLLRRSGSTCRGISPSDSRPKRPKQPSSAPAAATVSRQSSLRSTPQRAVVLRTRSKSVSVADSAPKEAWTPGFNCTPVAPPLRRRPRSDPAASPVVAVESNPGPRPQEAGGEAMISEETSASSSEDESSASSDLPRLAMEFSWSESEG